jgi:hypothetical protein
MCTVESGLRTRRVFWCFQHACNTYQPQFGFILANLGRSNNMEVATGKLEVNTAENDLHVSRMNV